jgi:hypothetical protein
MFRFLCCFFAAEPFLLRGCLFDLQSRFWASKTFLVMLGAIIFDFFLFERRHVLFSIF